MVRIKIYKTLRARLLNIQTLENLNVLTKQGFAWEQNGG